MPATADKPGDARVKRGRRLVTNPLQGTNESAVAKATAAPIKPPVEQEYSFSVPNPSGNNFPDALAGSVYAALNKAPILLVDNSLTDDQLSYLGAGKVAGATIFGGEGAVNKDIEGRVVQVLAQPCPEVPATTFSFR